MSCGIKCNFLPKECMVLAKYCGVSYVRDPGKLISRAWLPGSHFMGGDCDYQILLLLDFVEGAPSFMQKFYLTHNAPPGKPTFCFFVLLMLPIYKGPASSRKSSCLFPVYQWILPPGKPGCSLSPPLIGTYFLSWGMQGSLIISAQGSVLKASIQLYRLPPTWAWEHIFLFSLFLWNKKPDVSKCWKCFEQVLCHKVSTQE